MEDVTFDVKLLVMGWEPACWRPGILHISEHNKAPQELGPPRLLPAQL